MPDIASNYAYLGNHLLPPYLILGTPQDLSMSFFIITAAARTSGNRIFFRINIGIGTYGTKPDKAFIQR
jgi:hypothetical protein